MGRALCVCVRWHYVRMTCCDCLWLVYSPLDSVPLTDAWALSLWPTLVYCWLFLLQRLMISVILTRTRTNQEHSSYLLVFSLLVWFCSSLLKASLCLWWFIWWLKAYGGGNWPQIRINGQFNLFPIKIDR